MDVLDVATRCRVTPDTIRSYHKRGEMPPADTYFGRSPVWKASTIEGWQRSREKRWDAEGKPFDTEHAFDSPVTRAGDGPEEDPSHSTPP